MNDYLGPYLLGPNDMPENGIYTGDARELAKAIPDESVDLIFTDPPYALKYLYLYEWLFRCAGRVLKPMGFLMTYVGTLGKAEVILLAKDHLSWFCDLAAIDSGNKPILWPRKLISGWKSILVYRKPGCIALPRYNVLSCWTGGGQDKRYHTWGQDESTARYYTDCFSAPNAIVWDAFCGGGTVLAVCKMLGRKYLAFEIGPDVAETARERVRNTQMPLFVLEPEQKEMMLNAAAEETE